MVGEERNSVNISNLNRISSDQCFSWQQSQLMHTHSAGTSPICSLHYSDHVNTVAIAYVAAAAFVEPAVSPAPASLSTSMSQRATVNRAADLNGAIQVKSSTLEFNVQCFSVRLRNLHIRGQIADRTYVSILTIPSKNQRRNAVVRSLLLRAKGRQENPFIRCLLKTIHVCPQQHKITDTSC